MTSLPGHSQIQRRNDRPAAIVAPRAPTSHSFLEYHRSRDELRGLSLAVAEGLDGCQAGESGGYILVRSDLPAELYLEVPFVRRAWRLIDGLNEPGPFASIPVTRYVGSWSTNRYLAEGTLGYRFDPRSVSSILEECGLIHVDPVNGMITTPRRGHGLPRETFTGTSFFRFLNRHTWKFDDGLPQLSFVRRNGLLLLLLLIRSPSGLTAYDLADVLIAVAHIRGIPESPLAWLDDRQVMAAVIQGRLFHRVGPMLGLVEPVPDEERVPPSADCGRPSPRRVIAPVGRTQSVREGASANRLNCRSRPSCRDALSRGYRLTPFARRVMCRQI